MEKCLKNSLNYFSKPMPSNNKSLLKYKKASQANKNQSLKPFRTIKINSMNLNKRRKYKKYFCKRINRGKLNS